MNEAKILLIIVLIALVLVPIIYKIALKKYQDIDYKKQLEGKIPERTYQGKNPPVDISDAIAADGTSNQEMFKESCDAELRMRGMQNIIGPK